MPRRAYTAADVDAFFTDLRNLITIEQDTDDRQWRLEGLLRFWFYAMQPQPLCDVEAAWCAAVAWALRYALVETTSPTVH